MNPSTAKALDRLLDRMARPRRPRRRFSTAPITLGLALGVGYVLLTALVPRVWATMLPGGLAQANGFRGPPGLVWALARLASREGELALIGIGGTIFAAFIVAVLGWLPRLLVRLVAFAIIAADAGIVFITLSAAYEASARAAGLNLTP